MKKRKLKIRSDSIPYDKLLKKADAVFSVWIRTRDNWACVICGSKHIPQCGHLIKRGKHLVRFDEKNCNCQCASCNWYHNEYPEAYTRWFLKKYGVDEYERLCDVAFSTPKKHKFTKEFLHKIIEQYDNPQSRLPTVQKKSLHI